MTIPPPLRDCAEYGAAPALKGHSTCSEHCRYVHRQRQLELRRQRDSAQHYHAQGGDERYLQALRATGTGWR